MQKSIFDVEESPLSVRRYIQEGEIYDYTATAMLQWAVETGYLSEHEEIDWFHPRSAVTHEQEMEFYHSQKWDVIVFGHKKYLTNEAVSYDEARRICSHPSTRKAGRWFAGFALHGSCTNAVPGEPFNV